MTRRRTSFTATYIVVAIFLILAAYVVFFDTNKDDEAVGEDCVQRLDEEEISGVVLRFNDPAKGELRLEREEGGSWIITSPRRLATDGAAVKEITSTLADLEASRLLFKPEETVNLEEYGLNDPELTVITITRSGKELRFDVGTKTAIGSDYYVRTADGRIFTAPVYVLDNLRTELNELRSKKVIDLPSSRVTEVRLTRSADFAPKEGPLLHLKRIDGVWQVLEPIEEIGGNLEVSQLIWEFLGLEASGFLESEEDTPERYGLDQPDVLAQFSFTDRDGKAQHRWLRLKHHPTQTNGWYAQNSQSETIFLVDAYLFKPEEMAVYSVMAKNLITWQPEEIQQVSFFDATEQLELGVERLSDGRWQVTGSRADEQTQEQPSDATRRKDAKVSGDKLQDLWDALPLLRIIEVVPDPPREGKEPRIKLEVTSREGSRRTITIWEEGGSFSCRATHRQRHYKLDPADVYLLVDRCHSLLK